MAVKDFFPQMHQWD